MKRITAALGTLLILSGPALAAPSDPGPATATERPAPALPAPGSGDWRPMPPRGQRPPEADRGMQFAARLAAAETLIGIKSAQLDAWRGYTSALIDLVQPPAPPPPPSGDAAAGKAFARQEEMARRIKERAAKADTLLAAIATLRDTLTEAQLAALGRIDLVPRPPMPPFRGGPGSMSEHGPGHPPRDGGPMIAGPMGERDAPPPPEGDAPPATPDEPEAMSAPPAP